jgi:hypothetical protein
MKLDNRQFAQLQAALLHSFDRDALRMMVRLQLNENLDAVAGNDDLTTVVFDLITWAERTNRVGDLVNGALAANPANPELQQLAADYSRWQALAPAGASNTAPVTLEQTPPVRANRWVAVAIAALAVLLLAFWLLRPFLLPPDPIGPAPVEPTLPIAESPSALPEETATVTDTVTEEAAAAATATPSLAPSATVTPESTQTFTPVPSATFTPEPSATATSTPAATLTPQQAPRAPALRIGPRYQAFAEQSSIWTIKSGESFTADMRRLWSAPVGTPVDCASGVIFVSWQVRQPYPGGEDLEIRRTLPRGGGQTEVLARGARGTATVGYCDELILHNLGLEDYRLEWRYASALPR